MEACTSPRMQTSSTILSNLVPLLMKVWFRISCFNVLTFGSLPRLLASSRKSPSVAQAQPSTKAVFSMPSADSPSKKRKAEEPMHVDHSKKPANEHFNGSNGSSNGASNDALITSDDPLHPANHICDLCHKFYGHGWVTGTGGGLSIKHDNHVFIAPSGVQKELMKPTDMFVMDYTTKEYLRRPKVDILPYTCRGKIVGVSRLTGKVGAQTVCMYASLHGGVHQARGGLLYPHALPMGRARNPHLRGRASRRPRQERLRHERN